MKSLPLSLYRAAQIRELDRLAIEMCGIPGDELMERAGAAAFRELRRRWPRARRIGIVCGGGNNGGDGYVVARLAHEAGLDAQVIAATFVERLHGEAQRAAAKASASGLAIVGTGTDLAGFDLIIDALLGIGFSGELRRDARELIERMNGCGAPIFSLDLPSGLDADSGRILGAAVRASATICFIGLKAGCFTADGRDCSGDVLFDNLQLPDSLFNHVEPIATRLDDHALDALKPRARNAHKGHFGHVLVIGGERGFAGAVRMAGEAAARTGAGLVSVATHAEHAAVITAERPELMVHGVEMADDLAPLLARATVVAVGPGLGTGSWGRALLARVLECHKPLVVDADALTLLADEAARCERWVLTPHPGEAAKMLGCTSAEIQEDRYAAATSLQASFGGVVVLKGAGTLVRDRDGHTSVCTLGNPGMASGGMGDVLTGVIAALIAQGLSTAEAARIGVCLHAAAGDRAAREGERGLLATDLMPHLRRLANHL